MTLFQRGIDHWNEWATEQIEKPQSDRSKISFRRQDFPKGDFAGFVFSHHCNFEQANFRKPVSFEGAVFHGMANFSNTHFQGGVDFSGAVFHDTADFSNCRFANKCVFDGVVFHKAVILRQVDILCESSFRKIKTAEKFDLSDVRLNGGVRFDSAKFISGAIFPENQSVQPMAFDNAVFGDVNKFDELSNARLLEDSPVVRSSAPIVADFSSRTFRKAVSFENCVFSGRAIFKDTKYQKIEAVSFKNSKAVEFNFSGSQVPSLDFSGADISSVFNFSGCGCHGLKFKEASIGNVAIFDNATISHNDFHSAKFRGAALFRHTSFADNGQFSSALLNAADFSGARFFKAACFKETAFPQSVKFQKTTFSEIADFSGAKFEKDAIFQSAVFESTCRFSNAQVSFLADFEGAEFNSLLDLSSSRFEEVPIFHSSQIYPAADFETAQILDGKIKPREARHRWRTLKRHMSDIHSHEQEHEFFVNEMRARATYAPTTIKWLYRAYDLVSEYGGSVARPSAALAGLWAVFALAYAIAISGLCLPDIKVPLLSFINSFPFVGFGSVSGDLVKSIAGTDKLPGLYILFAAIHSVLATALWFLIGLALRNRFRIK